MTRRRFHVPRDLIREDRATLPPTQAHHLRDVLRLRTGDVVEIFDGAGSGYTGVVEFRGHEVFVVGLKSVPSTESSFRLTLAAALIKPAKFEWMLEKSTELGVDEIIPLITRFSEIRIPREKMESRLERWQRIVREASRQCRRSSEPRIHSPLNFQDFLAAGDFSDCDAILFYENSEVPWQAGGFVSDRIVLCIGPEGGWEQNEIELARSEGISTVNLGPLVLRAETAAIAALSILRHQIQLLGR